MVTAPRPRDGKTWREGRRSHNGTQFSQSIRLVRPIFYIYIICVCVAAAERVRRVTVYFDGESGGLDNDDLT
jgi:hypothetical protein